VPYWRGDGEERGSMRNIISRGKEEDKDDLTVGIATRRGKNRFSPAKVKFSLHWSTRFGKIYREEKGDRGESRREGNRGFQRKREPFRSWANPETGY